jgi:hypothetical protein
METHCEELVIWHNSLFSDQFLSGYYCWRNGSIFVAKVELLIGFEPKAFIIYAEPKYKLKQQKKENLVVK